MAISFVDDFEQIGTALAKLEAEKRTERLDLTKENYSEVYESSLGFIASDFDPA